MHLSPEKLQMALRDSTLADAIFDISVEMGLLSAESARIYWEYAQEIETQFTPLWSFFEAVESKCDAFARPMQWQHFRHAIFSFVTG